MEQIRIQNLRSLKDTGFIDIKPLTFLLGKNSSGKSTFLRTFPLLKQSSQIRSRGPLNFYGKYVDFGSFEECRSRFSSNKDIIFEFKISLDHNKFDRYIFKSFYRVARFFNISTKNDAFYKIYVDKKNDYTYSKEISIKFNEFIFILNFDKNNKLINILINDEEFIFNDWNILNYEGLIPLIISDDKKNSFSADISNIIRKKVMDFIRKIATKSLSVNRINYFLRKSGSYIDKDFLSYLQNTADLGKLFNKKVNKWDKTNPEFIAFKNILGLLFLPALLDNISSFYNNFVQNIEYIAPIRVNTERYYRLEDLKVENVDPNGKNLPSIIRSLSKTDDFNFRKWTLKTFGFELFARFIEGHVSLKIKEKDDDIEYNVVDKGFGFTQILPIIIQLWLSVFSVKQNSYRRNEIKIICIEQPELHLHPEYQTLIADCFCNLIKDARENGIQLKLLIETHSKSIINEIGLNIYNKKIEDKDVNIVLFDNEKTQYSEIKISKFDKEGVLINWPHGFFD